LGVFEFCSRDPSFGIVCYQKAGAAKRACSFGQIRQASFARFTFLGYLQILHMRGTNQQVTGDDPHI
jgi:hypothetical protein